jgi:hypothetical protein
MHKDELRLRERAYRNGWLRERKLHMIWRAIARRQLSCAPCTWCEFHRHGGDQSLSCGGDRPLRQSESV